MSVFFSNIRERLDTWAADHGYARLVEDRNFARQFDWWLVFRNPDGMAVEKTRRGSEPRIDNGERWFAIEPDVCVNDLAWFIRGPQAPLMEEWWQSRMVTSEAAAIWGDHLKKVTRHPYEDMEWEEAEALGRHYHPLDQDRAYKFGQAVMKRING